jgi:hypothetical protein
LLDPWKVGNHHLKYRVRKKNIPLEPVFEPKTGIWVHISTQKVFLSSNVPSLFGFRFKYRLQRGVFFLTLYFGLPSIQMEIMQ